MNATDYTTSDAAVLRTRASLRASRQKSAIIVGAISVFQALISSTVDLPPNPLVYTEPFPISVGIVAVVTMMGLAYAATAAWQWLGIYLGALRIIDD